jgi:Mn-dependent DtxR family transcriptional regulator
VILPYGRVATVAVENYLKHVLLLSEADGALVPMGALAAALGVVPGTATTMVKALAAEGLVEHRPRLGVRLSVEGRRLALTVLRKHRLVETFLVNVLTLDWGEVVMHRCHNKPCCNPAHLYLGDMRRNCLDREERNPPNRRGEMSVFDNLAFRPVVRSAAIGTALSGPRVRTCQYPFGDVGASDYHYCDDPNLEPGQSYCLEHCRVCFIGYRRAAA